jgi:hypothetical protein
MASMQHIKGTECNANLFAIFFEFTNMVEYHTTIITEMSVTLQGIRRPLER